mmetsp:Transcript_31251/g.89609  ORF Transcript_31251/g.89609 Transcript_31251/m.89609 type:complete len:241 (-) Transcript_31251:1362-2084(-)
MRNVASSYEASMSQCSVSTEKPLAWGRTAQSARATGHSLLSRCFKARGWHLDSAGLPCLELDLVDVHDLLLPVAVVQHVRETGGHAHAGVRRHGVSVEGVLTGRHGLVDARLLALDHHIQQGIQRHTGVAEQHERREDEMSQLSEGPETLRLGVGQHEVAHVGVLGEDKDDGRVEVVSEQCLQERSPRPGRRCLNRTEDVAARRHVYQNPHQSHAQTGSAQDATVVDEEQERLLDGDPHR